MPSQHVRSVSLTPELAAWVDEQVATGDYGSASELFREALRDLKKQRDQDQAALAEIRQRLESSLDAIARGEGVTGSPRDIMNAIRDRAKQDLAG